MPLALEIMAGMAKLLTKGDALKQQQAARVICICVAASCQPEPAPNQADAGLVDLAAILAPQTLAEAKIRVSASDMAEMQAWIEEFFSL